ncbi:MAG: GTP-binding protein [Candidatus Carsonella ruddii]
MKTYYINKKNYINEICNILNIKKEEFIKIFFLNNGILTKNINFEKIIIFCKKIFNLNILENTKIVEKNINCYLISIIGDVNSGKTTLIDFIFKKNICFNEIGKITQFVSMFNFNFNNKKIFLIDLPGHEFFNSIINLFTKISNIIFIIVSIENEINDFYKNVLILLNKNIDIIICLNKIDILNKNFYFNNYKIFKISSKNGYNVKKLILNSIKNCNSILINDNLYGFIINSYILKKDFYVTFFLIKGFLKLNNFIYFKKKNININNININDISLNIVVSPAIFIVKNIDIPVEFYFSLEKSYFEKKKLYNNFNYFIKSSNHSISMSLLDYFKKKNITNFKISLGNFNLNDLEYCINFNCKLFFINININEIIKKKIIKNKIFFKEFNLIHDFIIFLKNNINKKITKSESLIINIFNINNVIISGSKIIKGNIDIDDYVEIYNKNNKNVFKGYINTLKNKNKNVLKINKNKEFGITFKNFNSIEIGMKFYTFNKNDEK